MTSSKTSSSAASNNRCFNRGAWTTEEDTKLAQYVHHYGPRRWKSVALNSGLNRCGKSCRLRWLNYLRPEIKRGNISDAEDDLILRLHRLLGNRWSLIAQRLPGRTDNEIKNYWNSHLSKKAKLMEKLPAAPTSLIIIKDDQDEEETHVESMDFDDEQLDHEDGADDDELSSSHDAFGELFDFSTKGTYGLEWVKSFLELEEDSSKL